MPKGPRVNLRRPASGSRGRPKRNREDARRLLRPRAGAVRRTRSPGRARARAPWRGGRPAGAGPPWAGSARSGVRVHEPLAVAPEPQVGEVPARRLQRHPAPLLHHEPVGALLEVVEARLDEFRLDQQRRLRLPRARRSCGRRGAASPVARGWPSVSSRYSPRSRNTSRRPSSSPARPARSRGPAMRSTTCTKPCALFARTRSGRICRRVRSASCRPAAGTVARSRTGPSAGRGGGSAAGPRAGGPAGGAGKGMPFYRGGGMDRDLVLSLMPARRVRGAPVRSSSTSCPRLPGCSPAT